MDRTSSSGHLVFVYGTLKAGEPNHSVMADEATGRAEFMGTGTMMKKYPLVIGSRYNIPFLLAHEGVGNNVQGEVYAVDDEKMKALDILEAYPRFYTRTQEPILLATGDTVVAWTYLLPVWREELMTSEHFVAYSSKGSHGREYVASEQCEAEEDLWK
uniref:Gamma-glutamylcyclotransferase family protein n=1 Tax=Plectus sambesii TaxID=2011161 RepID=A0A914VZE8_9BILA